MQKIFSLGFAEETANEEKISDILVEEDLINLFADTEKVIKLLKNLMPVNNYSFTRTLEPNLLYIHSSILNIDEEVRLLIRFNKTTTPNSTHKVLHEYKHNFKDSLKAIIINIIDDTNHVSNKNYINPSISYLNHSTMVKRTEVHIYNVNLSKLNELFDLIPNNK